MNETIANMIITAINAKIMIRGVTLLVSSANLVDVRQALGINF